VRLGKPPKKKPEAKTQLLNKGQEEVTKAATDSDSDLEIV
jgi:hypothetical protein